ncbi:hypothetical protein [Nitrosomonas sp.]|nr:hypothetical protein [Nitrosomonas sp.]
MTVAGDGGNNTLNFSGTTLTDVRIDGGFGNDTITITITITITGNN